VRVPLSLRNLIFGLLIASVVWYIDHYTKQMMMERLLNPQRVEVVIKDFFNFAPVWNYGITFGLLKATNAESSLYLVVMAACISLIVLYWLWQAQTWLMRIGCGMIFGGALGNSIDRLKNGAVFDFLDVYYKDWHWPAFNMADVFIVCGVLLILWDGLFAKPEDSL
jgi:signal peptidase II